jgi:PAS domain S-box-containing protein
MTIQMDNLLDAKLNILLIEDNPSDAGLLGIYLNERFTAKYSLTNAPNLAKGIEHIHSGTFNIIIADLSLPDSSGLDTFRSIHEASGELPIIVLTGVEDEATGINAVKLGAQDFLIKGKISSKTLARSIRYSIERHKLLKELSENAKKLEEKTHDLIREKKKLSEALKLAHIGSWELEIENRNVKCSEELYRIFNLEPDPDTDVLERFEKYLHPADKDFITQEIEKALRLLHPFNFYHRILRPDNSQRILHTRGEVVGDETGKPIAIMGTSQDVTERFQEEELEKLVLAATKSYNSVLICDPYGKIEWVNEGFTKLSGYTLESVQNTYGEILKRGSEREILLQRNYYTRVLKEKSPVSFESMNFNKEGKGYWIITTLTPVLGKNKEVERIIAIDSDITMRKQMEEELLQANKIAEHSLLKGNKALTQLMVAKKQLEESMKVKEQFLANMSHEIRTPMNAIVGFTDLLLKTDCSADQRQYIEAIKTSGGNLLVIINDILDFSKIQSGKISFEQIELRLSSVVGGLKEMLFHKSSEKNIDMKMLIDERIPEVLIGDPTRLNQILLNLMGNAIKFTEKGGVSLRVSLVSELDNLVKLKFEISDTGIGIPAEKLSYIFEGFTQATNETTRKYGGTGLGLTIVKQLVELQGGTIDVRSTVGEGSTFTFTMQLKKCFDQENKRLTPSLEEPEIAERVEDLRILLVEDNYLNQVLAKKVMSDWKWEVDIAETGIQAIEKVKATDYDVILMDIQLPEMDGYEATRYIREKLEAAKACVPVIAMTAHAITGEMEKCFAAGMNDYISKPFDPKVLYTKIVKAHLKSTDNFQTENHPSKSNAMNHTKSYIENEHCTDLSYLIRLSNGSNEFVV